MKSAPPRLIAITDLSLLDPVTLLARCRRLAELARPESVALLLRDHAASGKQRLGLGRELSAIARDHGQSLWVADRIDLALLVGADGLHLGEHSVEARVARRLWGTERRVSRAWHSGELHDLHELEGVDALLLSPIVEARKGRPGLGVGALATLRETLDARHRAISLYALGGITAASAGDCTAAGAVGVAAIGAALAADPAPLLAALGSLR